MELAAIDTFARSDSPRGGAHAGNAPAGSFSDILDLTTRQPESTSRPPHNARDHSNARDNSEPRPGSSATAQRRADETSKADELKPEPSKSQERSESNSEAASSEAPSNTPVEASSETELAEAPADATSTENPTPVPEKAPAEAKGAGAVALDLINQLLATGDANIDSTMPKGQMVAAVVVPQNVPQHAAAAEQHSIPGLGVTPVSGAPTPPTPDDLLATPAPAPSPASVGPAAGTPAPATGLAPAAPHFPDLLEPVVTPPATQAAAPATPAAAAPVATAAETPVISSTAAQPIAAPMAEIVEQADVETLDVADEVAKPLTAANTNTGARLATPQTPVSGYVAQMVSQQAANGEAPVMPNAPSGGETLLAVNRDASALLAGAPAEVDEVLLAAKPADSLAFAATETSLTREAPSAESVAAARGARTPAVPVPEQIVVRIAKAIADGIDRINVKLSPAELGHIDVRMEIGPDGKFQAVFAADRPQTVELLQRDARELARALQDAGLRADTGSLSFNLRGQGQQGSPENAPGRSGSLPLAAGGGDLPSDVVPPPVYRAAALGAGRVDIRV